MKKKFLGTQIFEVFTKWFWASKLSGPALTIYRLNGSQLSVRMNILLRCCHKEALMRRKIPRSLQVVLLLRFCRLLQTFF